MGTRAGDRTVFERCPLCRQAAIETAEGQAIPVGVSRIRPCPTCGAIFADARGGRLRLRHCDPGRLSTKRGKRYPESACADCGLPITQCLLGKDLLRSEWERLSKAEPAGADAAEEKDRLASGFLPVLPAETAPISLEPGEVLHRGTLVYLCEESAPDSTHDVCQLALTDRRIILVHESGAFEISLADVESVRETLPGFAIYLRDAVQPVQCFPLPGDLIQAAIAGALRRFRQGEGSRAG